MESAQQLSTNVKLYMQKAGISVNSKEIEIKCVSGIATESQIRKICETFGYIELFEMKEGAYFVNYLHSADAMIAKETIELISVEDTGFQLSVDWVKDKEVESVFEIMPTPEYFVPVLRKANNMKVDPPESLKYIARFPLNLQESDNFHLKQKILGAKGCNFKKIVEICSKDCGIPDRPKDLIKIKLIEEPEFTIKLTSKYCSKFTIACSLVYELITVVLEEYKRYCEVQAIVPSDLRIRKLEQIKGRCRILRERKADPSIYKISSSQEAK